MVGIPCAAGRAGCFRPGGPASSPSKLPGMATRRRKRRRSRGIMPTLALPQLEQRHWDVIGLALVAFAAFFACVFYLDWSGGQVGEAMADGFLFLFGGLGYLTPVALFAAGALLVVRPMMEQVHPFRTGAACLAAALLLGLAAGSLGLGPGDPEDSEPVVRATHVEAPALDAAERYPDLYGHDEDEPEPQPTDELAGLPAPQEADEEPAAGEELTPMGNRRSAVTEADDVDYRMPRPALLKRSKR